MRIRQANMKDMKPLAAILSEIDEIHITKRPDVFKEKSNEDIRNNIEELMRDSNYMIWVSEDNDIIQGAIVCKIREIQNHTNLKDAKVLWINDICVKEEYRRSGIGHILIEKAKELARENDCIRMELNCWELNENAIKFYYNEGLRTQKRVMEIQI